MCICYKLPLTVCGDKAYTAKQKWYSGPGREVTRTASWDQDRAVNTEFFYLEIAIEIIVIHTVKGFGIVCRSRSNS